MRKTVPFPFLIRGRPKSCKGDRNIFVTHDHTFEVPEISAGETVVAMSVGHDRRRFANESTKALPRRLFAGRDRLELREYDGRLFRPHAFREEDPDLIDSAFPLRSFQAPISRPLKDHYEWLLDFTSAESSASAKTWPARFQPSFGYERTQDERLSTQFESLLDSLADFSQDDHDRNMAMIEKRAGGVISVDGELWVETPPLAIAVSARENVANMVNVVEIATAYVPENFDYTMTRRYFPLDRKDAAEAYACEWLDRLGRDSTEFTDLHAANVPETANDSWASGADIDWNGEPAFRAAMGLTQACSRFLAQNESWAEKTPAWLLKSAAAARSEMFKYNPVLGEKGDVAAFLPEIADLWKSFKRPLYTSAFALGRKNVDAYLDQCIGELQQRPININAFSFGT
jgi:hypothetical protein